MSEIISSLSPYALNLLVVSVFCLFWTCMIYVGLRGITSYASARVKVVNYWRSFWLCAFCVISLPFFLAQFLDLSSTGLVPEFSYDIAPPAEVFSRSLSESSLQKDRTLTLNNIDILAVGWALLYIGGTLLSLTLMVRRHCRLARELDIANEIDVGRKILGSLLTNLQYDYLAKNNVKVILTEAKCSPFVVGLFRHKLILPSYMLSMDAKEKELVMEHELTHIRRRDPMLIMLVHMLGCFLWFIPFIRWFKTQFIWAVELSCDRHVLKSSDAGIGKIYAQAMLRTLQQCSGVDNRKGVIGISAFNEISQLSLFKRRMVNIREATQGSRINKLKSGTLRVLLLICTSLFTVGGVLAKPSLSISSFEIVDWIIPVENARISSQFGELNTFRKNPHRGTDFAAVLGTPIVAPADGIIVVSTDHYKHKNYGKIIVIDHGEGTQTLYSHLDTREVEIGQRVKAGQKIGAVGATGKVTGPHLHFELIEKGERVDPEHLLVLWAG
ncbi:M23/M56 family metallopeptidase [Microbulbifer sp. GL-2]|uniref:M23/M56 family metallopeptidase n=1 Tax=Microbulbifer sp. GL-2 TaxID=2591606 RepID=UPI00117BE43F|nr:M23/M56 family metallopeptidase [Microbulbifer sp. GL-2]